MFDGNDPVLYIYSVPSNIFCKSLKTYNIYQRKISSDSSSAIHSKFQEVTENGDRILKLLNPWI